MSDKELKALITLLGDEDEEVFAHVHNRFVELGGTIIPFLEKEWEQNMDHLVQKRIEELIHTLHYDALMLKLRQWKDTGAINLLEGMWLVASYQYPDLKYTDLQQKIDAIYYEVYMAMGKENLHPLDQVRLLNLIIFERLGFSANTKNFHSPANSMLNVVLESHKGNPISLCVLYMLVAQKLKIPIYGINLPNLFVLTYSNYNTQFYINAFNKGIIFMRKDIDSYIEKLNLEKQDAFYEPCGNIDIIKRVLRNLTVSFEKLGEPEKVKDINALRETLED